MKNIASVLTSFILLPIIISIFTSCKKDEVKALPPTLTTSTVSSISATSATAGGTITGDGGAAVSARGVVWGTATAPTIALATKTSDGTGTGSFTSSISGLAATTTYFVRSYATNSEGTSYGNELSFTTSTNLSTVATNEVTTITATTATGGGNVSADGGSAITARGIVWSTSSSPTIALSTKSTGGSGTGNFSSSMSGLSVATKYFVRAYATNSIATSYGNEVSFTTLANLPALTTTDVTNITSSSGVSGGIISSDGGATVTTRGIVWGVNSTPTITLSSKTSDGTGTGNFTSSLSGLSGSTKYYLRAYATNAVGTSYGNEINFTTNSQQSHESNKKLIPVGGNAFADNGATIAVEGLTNWTNAATICKTYLRPSQAGTLNVSLKVNAVGGNNVIKVTALNKTVQVAVAGNTESEIFVGQWSVPGEGYVSIDVQGISKTSATFGTISAVYVSGTSVTANMAFVPNNDNNMFYWGRRGTALSLWPDITGLNNIEWYYSEVKVPASYDAIGSYYMANGFGEGYFGMQVKSPTERRVLFSVWSPFVTDNSATIPPEDQVILVRKGANVVTGSFGGEGSGGQSYLVYNWKADNTYKFLVQGKPIDNNFTQYTAWFYPPEEGKWLLIASWKRPKTSTYLKSLYSFIENFIPETGATTRMAYYGNQWAKPTLGNWTELTKGTVTGSDERVYRKDYAGGIDGNNFYLKISGFFSQNTPLNQLYTRPTMATPPNIDFSTLP